MNPNPERDERVRQIRERLTELTGLCGDHSCIFGPPKGLGTNGGCRCEAKRSPKVQQAVQLLREIAKEYFALLDSQAAGDAVDRKQAAWAAHAVVIKHECANSVRARKLAMEVLNVIEALPSNDAATRMCDACVAKVREAVPKIVACRPHSQIGDLMSKLIAEMEQEKL